MPHFGSVVVGDDDRGEVGQRDQLVQPRPQVVRIVDLVEEHRVGELADVGGGAARSSSRVGYQFFAGCD
jgi:hypothetical protein